MKEIATRFFLPTAVVGGVLALAGAALVFAGKLMPRSCPYRPRFASAPLQLMITPARSWPR